MLVFFVCDRICHIALWHMWVILQIVWNILPLYIRCQRSLFKYWFYVNFARKQEQHAGFWVTVLAQILFVEIHWFKVCLLLQTKVKFPNFVTLYLWNKRSQRLDFFYFSVSPRYLLCTKFHQNQRWVGPGWLIWHGMTLGYDDFLELD